DRGASLRAEGSVVAFLPRHAHHREPGRQEQLARQGVEGGQELTRGEIPARPEDDEGRGGGLPGARQSLGQRIGSEYRAGSAHAFFTAWPPNWWRSPAPTFPQNKTPLPH